MFADRAKNIRNQVNSWFFSEQINVEQLRNLNFEVDKLLTTPKQPKELLANLIKTRYSPNDLNSVLNKLENVLKGTDITVEHKTYLLAQYVISLNEFIFTNSLNYANEVRRHADYWESRKEKSYWYIYEKTPIYWIRYLISRNNHYVVNIYQSHIKEKLENVVKYSFGKNISTGSLAQNIQSYASRFNSAIHVENPNIELSRKLHKLKKIENYLFSIVGCGNKLMECFESIKLDGSWKQILHLLQVNQKILELFIDQAISLVESSDPQISLLSKEENGASDLFLRSLDAQFANLESQATGDLTDESTTTLQTCQELLRRNVEKLDRYERSLSSVINECKRPSTLQSNWLFYGTAGIALYGTFKYLQIEKERVKELIVNIGITITHFYTRYIEDPIRDIYKTIRYDTGNFGIGSENAMRADVDSLSRMLISFVQSKGRILTVDEINSLRQQALDGDLQSIMPVYEEMIKSPIKSAIMDDLIQLILIQVQKEKVDVEKAMLVLDKLLKSNELNFQVFTLVPAVLVVALLVRLGYGFFFNRIPKRELFARIRSEMRALERTLNMSGTNQNEKHKIFHYALINNGKFLISLNELRYLATGVPKEYKSAFEQDLQDLEFEHKQKSQRMSIIQRMYRTHPFLVVYPIG